MKILLTLTTALGVVAAGLPATPALGSTPRQTSPEIVVGMAIVDDGGNPVGNVEAVEGEDVLVRTDRHQARIPRASLRQARGRLGLSMTRAQLNAAIDQRAAPPPVQIQPGLTVRGSAGIIAGTIETVEPDFVVLRLTSGERAQLPRSAVGTDAQGGVISVSSEELQRLVAQASPDPAN